MRRSVLASAVVVCACSGAPPAVQDAARGDAPTQDTVWHAAAMPGHGEQPDEGPSWTIFRRRDPGVGLVFFRFEELQPPVRRVVEIRGEPEATAARVGRFVLDMPDGSGYAYGVEVAEAGLLANVLEYTYEESGVPLDTLSADGRWARVIYAYDAAGAQRRGWARIDDAHVGHVFWRDWLGERAGFFIRDDAIDLRDGPSGEVVEFPLEPSDGGYPSVFDYHLEADSTRGDWVRVRVVTPSDACGMEPGPVREMTGWTRVVDERGRPLVWYYTRGC